MITTAEIKSIDQASNKCTIRIPLFEGAFSRGEITMESSIIVIPGAYNCYKAGDMVWIAFAEYKLNKPIILGKIYGKLDNSTGQRNNHSIGGGLDLSSLSVADEVTLPLANTTFIHSSDTQEGISYADYDSIEKLISKIRTLETKANELTTHIEELETKNTELESKITELESRTFSVTSTIISDSTTTE